MKVWGNQEGVSFLSPTLGHQPENHCMELTDWEGPEREVVGEALNVVLWVGLAVCCTLSVWVWVAVVVKVRAALRVRVGVVVRTSVEDAVGVTLREGLKVGVRVAEDWVRDAVGVHDREPDGLEEGRGVEDGVALRVWLGLPVVVGVAERLAVWTPVRLDVPVNGQTRPDTPGEVSKNTRKTYSLPQLCPSAEFQATWGSVDSVLNWILPLKLS